MSTRSEFPKEVYLGDGVYAVYDGYGVTLDLRAQNDWKIALEPAVIIELERFIAKIRKYNEQS